ncbi:MAG TPA: hypothetical protein VFN11_12110 [Ktedonobacterales bacterium]|nr:hypothetical protein [Ktedonobacterales bacterium]
MPVEPDLEAWFGAEGLVRYSVTASAESDDDDVVEVAHLPLVALGPRDDDFVLPPHPDALRYAGKRLHDMTLKDYNEFIFRWFEAAIRMGDARCANCGRVLYEAPEMPPTDTWDAIFIEKDLVAWMLVHFDCKRWLSKKLTGIQPFELHPREAPVYELSSSASREKPRHS